VLREIARQSSNRAAVGFGWCSPEMAAQLQLYRARKKAEVGLDIASKPDLPEPPPMVPVATEAAPTGLVRLSEAKRVGGVSVQLDVSVERRRSFWWRLAVSLMARRL
jgi:hypothetical protein